MRWQWGSEDQLQNFLKGVFVQEGSSGRCFDHGQFEIKTFPTYALPYWWVPIILTQFVTIVNKCCSCIGWCFTYVAVQDTSVNSIHLTLKEKAHYEWMIVATSRGYKTGLFNHISTLNIALVLEAGPVYIRPHMNWWQTHSLRCLTTRKATRLHGGGYFCQNRT